MSQMIEPPQSVLLLVGREDFTPPSTFGGQACAATHDCLAVGVISVDDAPTSVTLAPSPATRVQGSSELFRLGDFELDTEGLLSLRDVYNREYDAMGVDPGRSRVTVWGDDDEQPGELVFEVQVLDRAR